METTKLNKKRPRILKSIAGKLLLTIGAMLIVSQIASTSLSLIVSKKQQTAQIISKFESDVRGISSTVKYFVKDELDRMNSFVYDPHFSDFTKINVDNLKKGKTKEINEQKYVTNIFKKQMETGYINNEFIVNKDGIVVASGDPSILFKDVSDREYFKDLKGGKTSTVSNLLISHAAGAKPIVVLAKRIYDDNKQFIGLVGKNITADAFTEILKDYNHGRYNVFLTDSTNTVIYNVNPEYIGKKNILDITKTTDLGDKATKIDYTLNGEDKIGVTDVIDGLNWTVCSTGYVTDIMKPVKFMLYSSTFVSVVVLLIAIAFTIFIAKKFSNPIQKLKEYCKRIATGDLSFRINDIHSGDEIEDLSKELNTALENLSSTLSDVKETVSVVNDQSSNLSAINEELSATNSEIVLAINDISERICDSANQANNCEMQTKDLEEAMVSLDQHNHIMIEHSDSVVDALTQNNTNLTNLLDSKEESTKSFKELKETIDSLILGVNNIGNFLNVINQIAEQTNLLSLNAAIEAARAGEAGKGFAVVSEEIRNLSSDTQVATENIGKIISQIDSLVSNTKKTLNTTEKLNVNENEYFNLMETSFEDMQASLEQMVSITQNISSEISVVNKKKDEVLDNISEVASVSQQIAAITEEVNASANEQSSTFDTINQSAQELQYTAEDVRTKVEDFKLD